MNFKPINPWSIKEFYAIFNFWINKWRALILLESFWTRAILAISVKEDKFVRSCIKMHCKLLLVWTHVYISCVHIIVDIINWPRIVGLLQSLLSHVIRNLAPGIISIERMNPWLRCFIIFDPTQWQIDNCFIIFSLLFIMNRLPWKSYVSTNKTQQRNHF